MIESINTKESVLLKKKKIKYNEHEWYYIDYSYNYRYVENPITHPLDDKIIYWVKRIFKGEKVVTKYRKDDEHNSLLNLFETEFYDNEFRRVNLKIGVIECVVFKEHINEYIDETINHIYDQTGIYTKSIFKDNSNECFMNITQRNDKSDNPLLNILELFSKMEKLNRVGSIKKNYIDKGIYN